MNKSTPIKFQFKTQSYVKGVPVNITVTPENLLKIFYLKYSIFSTNQVLQNYYLSYYLMKDV